LVVLGRDNRQSSAELAQAVARGVQDAGATVLDLGLAGTEEMYFATTHFGACGGIEITASHNPIDYNGMKMVKAGSAPLDSATELAAIRAAAEAETPPPVAKRGGARDIQATARAAYVAGVLGFVDVAHLRPLRVLVNAGHGSAGPTFDALAARVLEQGAPLEIRRLHHHPDGSFPQGIPNPLLPENQQVTSDGVRAEGADIGIAWDGDFDRCFFFDETGAFVDGAYIVGLLAAAFVAREPGAVIVHDPRIIWNTRHIVAQAGGRAVQARTGHAYIKSALRAHGAVYGGEMSAHHYFRDFMCCDSGMIPWLLVLELMGRRAQPLSALVAQMRAAFPASGEINFRVADPQAVIRRIESAYAPGALARDDMDGLSLDMGAWRFNLRSSNTEPVLRLNVETRGDRALLDRQLDRLRDLIVG
jgi:phosphomannomutase